MSWQKFSLASNRLRKNLLYRIFSVESCIDCISVMTLSLGKCSPHYTSVIQAISALRIRIRNVFIRSLQECIQSNNVTILDRGTPINLFPLIPACTARPGLPLSPPEIAFLESPYYRPQTASTSIAITQKLSFSHLHTKR